LGHSRRDAHRTGLSDRTFKFFRQYSGNEAAPMSQFSITPMPELVVDHILTFTVINDP
jgi:hypothetical protein